jgi:iron complex outermembrane receptor protein
VALFALPAIADDASAPGEADAADSEPAAVEKDVLFVEDSLPFIPTSNTIATKLPVELRWTPANVGVVPLELMDQQNSLVLTDALENVSGVNVQTFSGVFDFFVVRGFDSVTSGLVLTDGAPEPEATFYQMYNAERVEVFKGPAGFLYGSNPLAGAVNIVRKQPVPADFGVFGLAGGSFGTLEGELDVNQANQSGTLSFRLNGLYRESDGYRERTDSEVTAFNPALTWTPNERSSVNFNFELVQSDYLPDAGLPLVNNELPNVDRKQSYASPFDFSEQEINRFQIDYEYRLSDRSSLRNKLYGRTLDWQTNGTLLFGTFPSPFGTVVGRSLTVLDDEQEFWGNQFEFLYESSTGGIQHNLVAGLEVARYTDEFTLDVALLPFIGLDNPIETAEPPLFFLPGQSAAGDAQSDVIAPYLVDQITFTDKFQAMVGVRWDNIDFEDDVRGQSRSDSEVSPLLGLVYSPGESLAIYANAARSFAPPSPRAAGGLEPEESEQIEVGVRKEWLEGRVRSTFALFQLDRENIAIPDDNGFTQQIGDQRARGLEIETAFDVSRGLTGTFVYAYTDSELTNFTEFIVISTDPFIGLNFDRSGNTSAFAPEHLGKFWLNKRLANGLSVAGGVRYVGDQFIAEDNEAEIDAHALVDAAVTYTLSKWRFSLHLKNLLDEEYETRGFGSSSVIPGDPAAAFVGIERRF